MIEGLPRTLHKRNRLKTLFDIQSGREPGADHHLLVELGREYCAYAALDRAKASLDSLHYVSFAETEAAEHVATLTASLRDKGFRAATVCSAYPQSLLVPTKYFNDDFAALDLLYGGVAQRHFSDAIPEWQMVNIYGMPHRLAQFFDDSFASVNYFHAYTPSIKIYSGFIADNQLLVHFSEQYFRVVLKKDMAIQLAQTYAYRTPLDVVYFLLKINQEFALDQQDLHLVLSGLVEKDSALFSEIRQYFTHVHFATKPEISMPADEHPHHFFTSLFNLAACVS